MPRLIAVVTVIAIVQGVRTTFAPGSELPELPAHDVAELKKMGCIKDLDKTEAADKAAVRADRKAGADFEREKKAIVSAQQSIAPPDVPAHGGKDAGDK